MLRKAEQLGRRGSGVAAHDFASAHALGGSDRPRSNHVGGREGAGREGSGKYRLAERSRKYRRANAAGERGRDSRRYEVRIGRGPASGGVGRVSFPCAIEPFRDSTEGREGRRGGSDAEKGAGCGHVFHQSAHGAGKSLRTSRPLEGRGRTIQRRDCDCAARSVSAQRFSRAEFETRRRNGSREDAY